MEPEGEEEVEGDIDLDRRRREGGTAESRRFEELVGGDPVFKESKDM